MVGIDGNQMGGRPSPLMVRALGSTFARLTGPGAGEGSANLIVLHDEGGSGVEALNWLGEFNLYSGWSKWVSGDVGRPAKVANLSAVRRTWPKTDAQSQEQASPWTSKGSLDRIAPNDLKAPAPERLAMLTRVATPSPFLFEKSIEIFPRPVVPALAARLRGPPPPSHPSGSIRRR
jgi:hypothetical protein